MKHGFQLHFPSFSIRRGERGGFLSLCIVIARWQNDAEAISGIATDAFSILAMTVLYAA